MLLPFRPLHWCVVWRWQALTLVPRGQEACIRPATLDPPYLGLGAVTPFLGLIPLILGLLRSTDSDDDLDLGVAPLPVNGDGDDENC